MLYKGCYKTKIIPPIPLLQQLVATDNNDKNSNVHDANNLVNITLKFFHKKNYISLDVI